MPREIQKGGFHPKFPDSLKTILNLTGTIVNHHRQTPGRIP
jgi:hypothetical protein